MSAPDFEAAAADPATTRVVQPTEASQGRQS